MHNPSTSTRHNLISLGIVALVFTLVYLRFTSRLGLYWDEYMAFYMLDRDGFAPFLSVNADQGRPMQAYHMWLVHALWPGSQWLIAAIILANTLLYRQIVRWLMPEIPILATLAAVIYLVTPIVWMSTHLTNIVVEGALLIGLISVSLGYLAVRVERGWRWLALIVSLALIPWFLFTYEMILVIEFVQALLILRAVAPRARNLRDGLRRAILWLLPWITVAGAFAYYRFVLYETGGYWEVYASVDSSRFDNISVGEFASTVWEGVYENIVLAWPNMTTAVLQHGGIYPVSLVLALTVALYIGWTLWRTDAPTPRWRTAVLLLLMAGSGFLVALFSNIIVAIGDVPSGHHLYDVYSRFQVIRQLGIIALWLGLLLLPGVYLNRKIYAPLLAIVVAGAVYIGSAGRIYDHQEHIDTWVAERAYFASLADAIPGVAENTSIIAAPQFENPMSEFGAAVNFLGYIKGKLFYQDDTNYMRVAFIFSGNPPKFPAVTRFSDNFSYYWLGDIERSLLVYQGEDNCIHVLNPLRPLPAHLNIPSRLREMVLYPTTPDPATLIRDTPPTDTTLRERYLSIAGIEPYPCEIPTYDPPNPIADYSIELIDLYTDDTPVIIEDGSGRLNVHLPDKVFPNVPESAFKIGRAHV